MISSFISFSDTAKFVDLARTFVQTGQWGVHHSFFNQSTTLSYQHGDLFPVNFYPAVSMLFSLIFKVFPVSDLSIVFTGIMLFFLSTVLVYRLSSKIFSPKVGIVASIVFLFQNQLYDYVQNCTTEIIFIFLSLLIFNLLLGSRFSKVIGLLLVPILLVTRQQAVIFVFCGLMTSIYLLKERISKKYFSFLVITTAIVLSAYLSWAVQNQNLKLSIFNSFGAINLPTDVAQGEYLRGQEYPILNSKQIGTKIFYNLYNFAKTPERIVSPFLFVFLLLSLFIKSKKSEKSFTYFVFTTLLLFVLAASATLPNARYLHPLLPYMVICASFALVSILPDQRLKNFQIGLIVLVLAIKPIGFLFLDTRFESKLTNQNQPPAYFQISKIMADNLPKDRLIITNLDAWSSWYQGLTTMWFPLNPDLLIPPSGLATKVDYIVITNYKEDDGDFNLGSWREVVYAPQSIQNKYLSQNYKVLKTFQIDKSQVRENKNFQGTILVKK